eukprot:3644213-Rhodomonas_salina.4
MKTFNSNTTSVWGKLPTYGMLREWWHVQTGASNWSSSRTATPRSRSARGCPLTSCFEYISLRPQAGSVIVPVVSCWWVPVACISAAENWPDVDIGGSLMPGQLGKVHHRNGQ